MVESNPATCAFLLRVMGPVGFEASVRVPLLVGFMVHYISRYKIILAAIPGNSNNNLKFRSS